MVISFLWSAIAFLVALGLLVTVHELGHFWVARRCGVHVERFSIGFGKTLWQRVDKKGTEYVLGWIPLGGYVRLLDAKVSKVSQETQHKAINHKTIGQRAAIYSAGSLANLLFALLMYWLVFMHGVPSIKPIIGDVLPNSVAAQGQITPGMELKSINGIEMPDWSAVRLALIEAIGKPTLQVGIAPFGSSTVTLKHLDLSHWTVALDKQDPVVSLGILPRGPEIEPVIALVIEGSAAQQAGLQVGDRIIGINGKPLVSWYSLVKTIQESSAKPVMISLERNGKTLTVPLIPKAVRMGDGTLKGVVGIVPKVIPLSDDYLFVRQYGPFMALYEAARETWQLTKLTVDVMGKIITGHIGIKALGGPISIAKGAGASAEQGILSFMVFLAFISINLGIVNLFPLPMLDGGHLLFLLCEKIKGSPVSEQVQEYCYRIGAIVLLLIIGLVLFNDFSRL